MFEFDEIIDHKYFAVFDKGFYESTSAVNSNRPYQYIETEKQNVLILNVAGISQDDIKINTYTEHKIDYLEITGSTQNELIEKPFTISTRFMINLDIIDKIDVDYRNGLLYVRMFKKEPEQKQIPINFTKQ